MTEKEGWEVHLMRVLGPPRKGEGAGGRLLF
jgi:hypothetical protein